VRGMSSCGAPLTRDFLSCSQCAVLCYCGYTYLEDTSYGGYAYSPTSCWEDPNSGGVCNFLWREDLFGYSVRSSCDVLDGLMHQNPLQNL
jgi:hypothetical protein